MLQIVMPSCVAAMEREICSIADCADRAPTAPWLTNSSMRVLRTATRENSAATKKPFNAINMGRLISPKSVHHGPPPVSCANKNGTALLPPKVSFRCAGAARRNDIIAILADSPVNPPHRVRQTYSKFAAACKNLHSAFRCVRCMDCIYGVCAATMQRIRMCLCPSWRQEGARPGRFSLILFRHRLW